MDMNISMRDKKLLLMFLGVGMQLWTEAQKIH